MGEVPENPTLSPFSSNTTSPLPPVKLICTVGMWNEVTSHAVTAIECTGNAERKREAHSLDGWHKLVGCDCLVLLYEHHSSLHNGQHGIMSLRLLAEDLIPGERCTNKSVASLGRGRWRLTEVHLKMVAPPTVVGSICW